MTPQELQQNTADLKDALDSAEYGSYHIILGAADETSSYQYNMRVTATIGTFEYSGGTARGIRYTYCLDDGTRMDWMTVGIPAFLATFSTSSLISFESM